MTDENTLQSSGDDVVHPTETPAPESAPADLATATEVEESKEHSAIEKAQKAINRQHFKYREEQRKREQLQADLEAANKRINELSAPAPIDIPPLPDSWDENFQEKMRLRDELILKKAQVDNQAEIERQAQALDSQRRQEEQQRRSQILAEQFNKNAEKIGLDTNELYQAQQALVNYGIGPELATLLLEDNDGPLMTTHLAANPLDLSELVNASPIKAGLLLGEIKSKATAAKPKTTSAAPAPPTKVGGASGSKKDYGPQGAVYE